jgi:hypothetical protein
MNRSGLATGRKGTNTDNGPEDKGIKTTKTRTRMIGQDEGELLGLATKKKHAAAAALGDHRHGSSSA